MDNKFLISFIIIFVVGVLAIAITMSRGGDTNIPVGEPIAEHVKGNSEATLTLVEYSDLQCSACGVYFPVVSEIVEEFDNDLKFVYRHFPLRQIHQYAQLAAEAAEAAGKQGAFWEMHDVLFLRQSEWSSARGARNTFIEYAEELGLDGKQLERDMKSGSVRQKIDADFKKGIIDGVDSTPSFYLNGVKIENPRSLEDFRAVIISSLESNHE